MLPYFTVGFVVVSLSALSTFLRRRVTKTIDVLPTGHGGHAGILVHPATPPRIAIGAVAVILVAFAGFRHSTGTDYPLYLALYQAVDSKSLTDSLATGQQGAGFVTLMFVLKNITSFPYLIFWVSSVLTVVPVLLSIKRRSLDPVFALFLYFFLGFYAVSFNAVRQSIAVSLLLLADTYRSESKRKYVLLSILAISLHSSAVLMVLIQLVVRFWKPTYWSVIVVFATTILFSAVMLRAGAVDFISSELNGRYVAYLGGQGAGVGTVLVLVARVALIFLALSLPKVKDADRYIAFVCLSAIFLYLGLSAVVVARLELYFSVFLILLLPNQLAVCRHGKSIRLLLACVLLVYFAMYITSYNDLIPYSVVPGLRW